VPVVTESGQVDPIEVMGDAERDFNAQVETELLANLKSSSPEFFEKAVIDVLWAMGYGGDYGEKQHVGRTGDGGVDGIYDGFAERGQAAFVVCATGDAVAAVVSEMDLPHAEAVVERDHVRGFQKRQRAFEVEAEGKFATRSDAFDVGGSVGEFEPVRFGYLATVTGDGGHDLRERIHIHADVDGEIAHAGIVVQAQLVDVGVAM